jgi:ubiquinone/menaquinone biosynthesis C-methylase UbiE
MSVWGRVFAALYDRFLAASERNGLGDLRTELLAGLHGRVLEIGAGTGVNLQHYPRTGIDALVLTEPEAPMARRLEDRVAGSGRDAQVIRASADDLPFGDGSFDAVVCTLVLCTVPSVERTLAELRRVLVPGGRLLFLEHVRHDDPARARRQDRWTPMQRRIACGCHLNRDTPALIARAGFTVDEVRRQHFPKGPSTVQPLAIGVART